MAAREIATAPKYSAVRKPMVSARPIDGGLAGYFRSGTREIDTKPAPLSRPVWIREIYCRVCVALDESRHETRRVLRQRAFHTDNAIPHCREDAFDQVRCAHYGADQLKQQEPNGKADSDRPIRCASSVSGQNFLQAFFGKNRDSVSLSPRQRSSIPISGGGGSHEGGRRLKGEGVRLEVQPSRLAGWSGRHGPRLVDRESQALSICWLAVRFF